MIKKIIVLGFLATLTACSSENSKEEGGVGSAVQARVQQIVAERQKQRSGGAAAALITRERLAQVKKPIATIRVPNLGVNTLATNVLNNRGYNVFYTAAEQSFTFYDGELTATRGLSFDLLSRGLSDGSGRVYQYVTAEHGIAQMTANCAIEKSESDSIEILGKSQRLTRTDTVCRAAAFAFRNRIWRDSTGKPIKAEQWIGPQAGHAIIEWLN